MLKSPVSYLSDTEYAKLDPIERALHQARSQLGVEEVPRGSNWGPKVREYINAGGFDKPVFWCGCFVIWGLLKAAYKRKLPKNKASTFYWYLFAKENNILFKTPKRGDIFVWNNDGGGHMGWVVAVDGNRFRTFEGNSNSDGSRNGYAVVERWRTIDELNNNKRWGFVRLKDLK